MEEVLVEEWSKFFQAAGLSKTDQVKYTKAFTDNDVEMQSFCEMVSQHTESGIHFMKSLGVQPAGHQIKISMKAQKYRNIPQGCSRVKIEQIGITPTRQSNIKLELNEIIEFTPSSNKKSTGKNPLTIDSLYNSLGHQYPSTPSSSGCSTLEPPGHLQPQVHLRFQDVSGPSNSPSVNVNSAKQSNNNSKIDKFETSQKRLGTTKYKFKGKELYADSDLEGNTSTKSSTTMGIDKGKLDPVVLFVSKLPDGDKQTNKSKLQEVFPAAVHVRTSRSRAKTFAVVHFSSPADAEAAFVSAQGIMIDNHKIIVRFAKKDKWRINGDNEKKDDQSTMKSLLAEPLNKKLPARMVKSNKRKRLDTSEDCNLFHGNNKNVDNSLLKSAFEKLDIIKDKKKKTILRKKEDAPEDCKLFVHGIKTEIDDSVLLTAFEKFGMVTDFFNPGRGFAFVTFSTPDEARAAREAMLHTEVAGCYVAVKTYIPRNCKILVNNVSKVTSFTDLWDHFALHGAVTDAFNSGEGFATVTFRSAEDAEKAMMAVDGKDICGRQVQCILAKNEGRFGAKKIHLG